MSTVFELSTQWQNPSDVTTVLMVIGGDVVQKALAQCTGTLYAPVCFSFGWVAFAYTSLISVLGDGRLLPPPDHPVKVFNLESGYVRENKHWVVGRILRDHERSLARDFRLSGNGVRIAVFEAVPRHHPDSTTWQQQPNAFLYGWMHVFGLAVMSVQLVIAVIPIILYRDWGIMLITAAGTILALWFGSLPQWRVEKLPNRQHSKSVFALTSGNGARDIMVIKGLGNCLDLEEFSTTDTPRDGGPWEKIIAAKLRREMLGKQKPGEGVDVEKNTPNITATLSREGSFIWRSKDYIYGWPVGFVYTFFVCVSQSILWLLLLITVAALKSNTWFLVLVGGLGMFQNGILAAMERPSVDRGLVLRRVDVILTKKVMDGLMDLEAQYGCGAALVREFFPGKMKPLEEAWWNGDCDAYDDERIVMMHTRGPPRSRQVKYELLHTGSDATSRYDNGLPPEARDAVVSVKLAEEGNQHEASSVAPVVTKSPAEQLRDARSMISPMSGAIPATPAATSSQHQETSERRSPSGSKPTATRKFQPLPSIPDDSSLRTAGSSSTIRNPFDERESPDWS